MTRYSLVFAGTLLLLAVVSCVHDSSLPTPTPNPNDTIPVDTTPIDTGVNTCSPDTVYFQRDVLPILVSNCAMSGCHDDITHEDGIRLTSYANVTQTGKVTPGNAANSKLYKVLIDSDPDDRMPPVPNTALTVDQIVTIQKWINQGAKDLTCTSGCDTTAVAYTTRVQPFLTTYCVGCHSGAGASGGVKLTTYAEAQAVAQSGALYGAISGTGGFVKMPPSGTISACSQHMIKAWVNQGTPQ
jgi:cytochrome c5